ncbi:FecR family protein [Chitinophaga japonensis]|uniref:FecR family protein n=1 Tax=Chitinophaga japonensis TaxID=104662 RepID=A0A562T3U5_CHIJA|nr:FecR domain-containing protein [Chitinophaga japonensis]TWI88209.1 FecR family protein [Chitinophaga japonensis]
MQINRQLLERYFKGECTPAEVEQVEIYLSQDATPEMDAYLLETWKESAEEDMPVTAPVAPKKIAKQYRLWYNTAAAAAILLLISVSAWLWQKQGGRAVKPLAVQWDTIYNGGNTIRVVSMPDGSKIWLNAYSALAYTADYNVGARELWLEGEAYFDVAKMEGRPFRVHTGELVTTALGTTFNIATSNRADSSIAVSLLEGKVAVNAAGFSCVLQPGQLLLYNKETVSPAITQFKPAEVLDWKNGKLVFENAALEDVFAKLQARYGCTIHLQSKTLTKKKVSGVFHASETVAQILQGLSYVHNFNYEYVTDSNSYIIRKK